MLQDSNLPKKAFGMFLIATALLKIYSLNFDPVFQYSSRVALPLLWIAIIVEVSVGVLAMSSRNKVFSYLVLLIVFAVFTSFAANKLLAGHLSCGCTGILEIPLSTIFIFDCFAILLLVYLNIQNLRQFKNKSLADAISNVSVLTLMLFSLGWAIFELNTMLLRSHGSLVSSDSELDIGDVGQTIKNATIELRNIGKNKIRLLRVSKGCNCLAAEFSTTQIEEGGSTILTLQVDGRGRSGPIRFPIIVEYSLDGENGGSDVNLFQLPIYVNFNAVIGSLRHFAPLKLRIGSNELSSESESLQGFVVLDSEGNQIKISKIIRTPKGLIATVSEEGLILIGFNKEPYADTHQAEPNGLLVQVGDERCFVPIEYP